MRLRAHAVVATLLVAAASSLLMLTTAAEPSGKGAGCKATSAAFAAWSSRVWDADRWRRGAPKKSTVRAQRRWLRCAKGPGHRAAMQERWKRDKRRYNRERKRCAGAYTLVGRVSYFNGPASTTASGKSVHIPGLALNIAPGTDSGWNNSTTRSWVSSGQMFRVTIAGHTATMPVTDLGPSGFTGRAIDVTEAGVLAMGLSPSSFPTDSIGVAKLIPRGC